MTTTKKRIPTPKRKSVEITASFSGTIETGRYSNEKPMFSIKEIWTDIEESQIQKRQIILEQMCYQRFTEVESRSVAEKILEQRKDMRFYDHQGMKLPSVTSIIGWDDDFYMPPAQLAQHAARGTILHKQAEIYMKTGQWLDPKDIPEVYPEYVCVIKGDLQLKLDDVNFKNFYDETKDIEIIELEKHLFNLTHRYAGRCDIIALVNGKKTVCDIKTGSTINQEKAFKQISAYAKSLDGIEQMMVIHLNNKTKQGYSKPIVSNEIEKHFQLFLKDREIFKMRFGL